MVLKRMVWMQTPFETAAARILVTTEGHMDTIDEVVL